MATPTAARPERLRDGRDIAAVLRGRHQRAGRLLVLHARPEATSGPPRVAVVASRKVGSAVARNRAKRLLREAAAGLPWVAGVDVVMIARADCAHSVRADVEAELARLAHDLDVVAS